MLTCDEFVSQFVGDYHPTKYMIIPYGSLAIQLCEEGIDLSVLSYRSYLNIALNTVPVQSINILIIAHYILTGGGGIPKKWGRGWSPNDPLF